MSQQRSLAVTQNSPNLKIYNLSRNEKTWKHEVQTLMNASSVRVLTWATRSICPVVQRWKLRVITKSMRRVRVGGYVFFVSEVFFSICTSSHLNDRSDSVYRDFDSEAIARIKSVNVFPHCSRFKYCPSNSLKEGGIKCAAISSLCILAIMRNSRISNSAT